MSSRVDGHRPTATPQVPLAQRPAERAPPARPSEAPAAGPTRIVVLGGGFAGVTATRHLERMCRQHAGAEITLVSRENFFVLTPLLFEACSGRLELRHCAQPIRPALRRARFVEATVEQVDVERQVVRAVASDGGTHDLPYDQLVVALGATTNETLIPGSPVAFTFKSDGRRAAGPEPRDRAVRAGRCRDRRGASPPESHRSS